MLSGFWLFFSVMNVCPLIELLVRVTLQKHEFLVGLLLQNDSHAQVSSNISGTADAIQ